MLAAALLALGWANSPWSDMYFHVWEAKLSFDIGIIHLDKSLQHWINDGLMTLFFFLVGMEIKGELIQGYLSSPKKAALPAVAALGGMMVPASCLPGSTSVTRRSAVGESRWQQTLLSPSACWC